MSDDDLEALREQTERGDRTDQEADSQTGGLQASIAENLEKIDSGERQKTVSVWDGQIAALVAALDEDEHRDELQEVGEALRETFDVRLDEPVDRSEVLRRALRLGLREAAPEHMKKLREAVRDQAARDL